jgi:hypothetical protein
VAWSSILLRLLLSLSLILNGSGYAAAAVKMPMEHAASVAAAHEKARAEEAPPCPEHTDVTPADDHGAVLESVTHEHDRPECCKSAKCAGACFQHAPAAIVAQCMGPAAIEHSDAIRQIKAAHATPALPHRIRPPIG